MGFRGRRQRIGAELVISLCRLTLALGLLVGGAHVAWAEAETPDAQAERAQQISSRTLSPFCPGRTLSDCPSPYATEWRRDIREMVAKGMTNDQIREVLEQRTSKDLSGEPSTALDGILPVAVTVAAVVLLVLLLRMLLRARGESDRKKKQPDKQTRGQMSDAQLEERLKDELDKFDGDLDD